MYLFYIFVYICYTYSSTGLEGLCPFLNVGGGGLLPPPKPPWLQCHCYISSVIIIIIIIIIIIDVSFQLQLSLRCAVADPVDYKVDSLLYVFSRTQRVIIPLHWVYRWAVCVYHGGQYDKRSTQ